jgi:tannase/feruloyl esterase
MSLAPPHTTITAAEPVTAGAFRPSLGPEAAGGPSAFGSLPGFCRVQGVITPTTDSHIEFEVWLPAAGWNRKYQGAGNGGFAGSINYANMASALRSGYAASSTDTGHKAGATDAQWALGHPEKIADFGYRAIHETAETSKAIIRTFYGEGATHSYFSSCSNGGREALMEAQRYPADYDGIIAGAPAANFTRIAGAFAWNMLATAVDPASYIPARKFTAIEAAAVAACDARDGVKDGIIDEPGTCGFDPTPLLCTGPESDACLTGPQLAALKKIYAGPRTSKGEPLYPGFVPGGESGPGGWPLWIAGARADKSLQYAFSTQAYAYLIFQNPAYDYRAFNVDRDVKAADDLVGRTLNAIDPNLRAFEKRGGKLILYHGWSDAALPPTATIDYYRGVATKMGQKEADRFVRLYMVPGMQHCGGGPGADNFGVAPGLAPPEPDPSRNMSAALERWVEQDVPPAELIATKYKTPNPTSGVAFTRRLCPYPKVAQYKGSGDQADAANFVCANR